MKRGTKGTTGIGSGIGTEGEIPDRNQRHATRPSGRAAETFTSSQTRVTRANLRLPTWITSC